MPDIEQEKINTYREKLLIFTLVVILLAVNAFLFYAFFRFGPAIPKAAFTPPAAKQQKSNKQPPENTAPDSSIRAGKEAESTGPELSFLFVGDIMVDRHVGEKIAAKGFDYLLKDLAGPNKAFFADYDLVSANLEGAVTDKGKHYPPVMNYDFAFAPEIIKKFTDYNFNFFNLANNHFADQGEQGIKETRNNLDKLNIAYSGCRDKKLGVCTTKIINIKDKKIGLAGMSMVYGTFKQKQAEDIVAALAGTTDLVIINIHWGREYEHQFNKTQQIVAHGLIDAGADIIIGHHPHVVEGMEIYRGKAIFYSLGNFIFDQYFSADTQEELAVAVNMKKNRQIITLLPLKAKLSRLRQMKEQEQKAFFKKFVSWSALSREKAKNLRQGTLSLPFSWQ